MPRAERRGACSSQSMPEILTKHPEVVLSVLKTQGAQCGAGAGVRPKILTSCPIEKFCALSGGELCVYGPNELQQMTQLSRAEVCGLPQPPTSSIGDIPATAVIPVVLATAAAFGVMRALRSRKRRASER